MKRSVLDKNRGRRLGPPPSMQNAKREPTDEQITIRGVPAAITKNVRTLRPEKTSLKPQRVGVPDKARAEKGMSLALLLKKQPKYLLNSAEDVVIRSYKKAKTKGGMPAIIGTARDLKTKPMVIHRFQVIGLDKEKQRISTQKRIKISCDCGWFTFYSEYALWTWGAANIRYSNGQPAVVRNPGNHPIACKHLVKVLTTIRQHND